MLIPAERFHSAGGLRRIGLSLRGSHLPHGSAVYRILLGVGNNVAVSSERSKPEHDAQAAPQGPFSCGLARATMLTPTDLMKHLRHFKLVNPTWHH